MDPLSYFLAQENNAKDQKIKDLQYKLRSYRVALDIQAGAITEHITRSTRQESLITNLLQNVRDLSNQLEDANVRRSHRRYSTQWVAARRPIRTRLNPPWHVVPDSEEEDSEEENYILNIE